MSSLLALVSVLALVISGTTAGTAPPIDGRLVDARSGAPIAGAEITIVGRSGSVRTDALGRFHWPAAPPLPIDVIAVLPDGRVAGPIRVTTLGTSETLTLTVDAAVSETVTVLGAAPTLDAAPGASTSLLTRTDLELRHVQTLSQALDVVPGVSAISEGQAAVPAIRGLARGRTLILVDGARASTERRAGANASFLDPAIVRTIEVARGPGSVAYGSDAFGGVIAARTRGHRTSARPCACALPGPSAAAFPNRVATSSSRRDTGLAACSSRSARATSTTTRLRQASSPTRPGGTAACAPAGSTRPVPIAGRSVGRATSAARSAGRAATVTSSARPAPTRTRTG